MRFNRSWPFTENAGRFYKPWAWAKNYRFGAGLRVTLSEDSCVEFGYRHWNLDTSDEREGDAADLQSDGPVLAYRRRF